MLTFNDRPISNLSFVALSSLTIAFCVFLAKAQGAEHAGTGVLQGFVHDSHNAPVAGATVRIQFTASDEIQQVLTVDTDATGHFQVSSLRGGACTMRAKKAAFEESTVGPFVLRDGENRIVDIPLESSATSLQFFDEPKFTVAGVTDHAYAGGHGSGAVLRSSEELARAAASLSNSPSPESSTTLSLNKDAPAVANSIYVEEEYLRAEAARKPHDFEANYELGKLLLSHGNAREGVHYLDEASRLNSGKAELHRLIATTQERLGNPLEAVREYQRAAELDPNEINLFDLGSELLLHRATEPAVQIFQRGIGLFPHSSRMLLGGAVAFYSYGDFDRATQLFFKAVDLNPNDPDPYMFLGRVESPEIIRSPGFVGRMAQFARVQPQNAAANYYFGLSLWNTRTGPQDKETVAKAQTLLEKAVSLDPSLAVGYQQLGIVYSAEKDLERAIPAYQRAIELDFQLEQAHYRLAQAYRQLGETSKAQHETELFRQLAKSSAERRARDWAELGQFVVALRSEASN